MKAVYKRQQVVVNIAPPRGRGMQRPRRKWVDTDIVEQYEASWEQLTPALRAQIVESKSWLALREMEMKRPPSRRLVWIVTADRKSIKACRDEFALSGII